MKFVIDFRYAAKTFVLKQWKWTKETMKNWRMNKKCKKLIEIFVSKLWKWKSNKYLDRMNSPVRERERELAKVSTAGITNYCRRYNSAVALLPDIFWGSGWWQQIWKHTHTYDCCIYELRAVWNDNNIISQPSLATLDLQKYVWKYYEQTHSKLD